MSATSRLLAAARFAAVAGVSVLAVVGLHRLGERDYFRVDWTDVGGWLAVTPPEDVVVAGVRLLGLAVAWWVLASSLLYVAARAARLPGAVRTVEWAVLPPVRRLADRAVAATLLGSSVLGASGQALAVEPDLPLPPPVVIQTDTEHTDAVPPGSYVPTPAGPGETSEETGVRSAEDPFGDLSDEASPVVVDGWAAYAEALAGRGVGNPPPVEAPARADDMTAQTHTVTPGEHLWGIAEAQLRAGWGRQPTTAETASHWLEVIAVNRDRLASQDPDLIFPGEVLELPETPPRPDREE